MAVMTVRMRVRSAIRMGVLVRMGMGMGRAVGVGVRVPGRIRRKIGGSVVTRMRMRVIVVMRVGMHVVVQAGHALDPPVALAASAGGAHQTTSISLSRISSPPCTSSFAPLAARTWRAARANRHRGLAVEAICGPGRLENIERGALGEPAARGGVDREPQRVHVDMRQRADLDHQAGDAARARGRSLLAHEVDQRGGDRKLMHGAHPRSTRAWDGAIAMSNGTQGSKLAASSRAPATGSAIAGAESSAARKGPAG